MPVEPTSPGRVENASYLAPTRPGNWCPCSCIVTGMHHVSTFAAVIPLHYGQLQRQQQQQCQLPWRQWPQHRMASDSGSGNAGWLMTAATTVAATAIGWILYTL